MLAAPRHLAAPAPLVAPNRLAAGAGGGLALPGKGRAHVVVVGCVDVVIGGCVLVLVSVPGARAVKKRRQGVQRRRGLHPGFLQHVCHRPTVTSERA